MFRCLVMRHAAAQDRAASGLDSDRELTRGAMDGMIGAAAGLARIIDRPDLIISSPFERAYATADILAREYPGSEVECSDVLTAGAAPEDILAMLGGRRGRCVALVGHEPDMGRFVSLALAGTRRSFFPMRKGQVCLLEFPAVPRAGNATLEWAMAAEHLALMTD